MIQTPTIFFNAWTCFLLGLAFLLIPPYNRELNAAASPDPPGYFFESWPEANGLELNAVTTIVQTQDGYLWLGTYNGLVRFDGERFVVFNSSNTRGLQNSRITALFPDNKGALWIGHETGDLTEYKNGQFCPAKIGFTWVGGPIDAINMDENGDVWLGSSRGGVFRLRDGQCCLLEIPDKGWPAWMVRDQSGRLFVVSNGTTGRIKDGVFESLHFDGTGSDTNDYQRVLPARDGGWWVLRNFQIGKWRDGRWEQKLRSEPWIHDYATDLLETSSGDLIVSTFLSGIYLFHAGEEPRQFTRTEGLSSNQERCLFKDQEGNIWVGTSNGLGAMRLQTVKMLNPPDDWGGHTVLSFWAQPDGSVWIGTQGAGLYYYNPGQSNAAWTNFKETNGLPGSFVWSVLETQRGEFLIGTWGAGLIKKNGDQFESFGEHNLITSGVLALFESKTGALWVGTSIGIQKYEGDKLTWFAGKDRLNVPDVRAIRELHDGTLWFGMLGGGLARLKDGTLKQFRKSDGMSSDFIDCLYVDSDDTLWIGTTDSGLIRMKEGSFSTINVGQGLASSFISQIVDDHDGNLWLGSDRGILRASKVELNRCADETNSVVHCLSYGKAEGLTSQTCPGGFQPGAALAPNGALWFPTTKGIAMIDPKNVTVNTVPPPMTIEAFIVDGKPVEGWIPRNGIDPVSPGNSLTIPPGKQRIEFRYTALSFAAPDRVHFKYRLQGLENDWVDAGNKRSVEYTHLPPGAYEFHVIASNNDDVWNETGASLFFKLQPYFWQTWWFQIGAVLTGAGAIGGIVLYVMRRRVRRKLEQLEAQRGIERERARIARDIHDDVGASLTRITMLSHTMQKEFTGKTQASSAAAQVNSTARDLMRAMDEIVWAVDPKHDTLDSLATYLGGYAQDFLEAAGIRCRLDVPMQLPNWAVTAELRHNVFLTLKEALHNVVKHSAASEVELLLELTSVGFILRIEDNGRGFELNSSTDGASTATQAKRLGGGNGLINLQNRLKALGGHCEWVTSPGNGTRVILTIPVKS